MYILWYETKDGTREERCRSADLEALCQEITNQAVLIGKSIPGLTGVRRIPNELRWCLFFQLEGRRWETFLYIEDTPEE